MSSGATRGICVAPEVHHVVASIDEAVDVAAPRRPIAA